MTYSVIDFNDEIIAHFPPKFRWDDGQKKSWVMAMVRELSGFSAEVLQRAARQLIATHKEDKTPSVAKCIAACSEAQRWVRAEQNGGKLQLDGAGVSRDRNWTDDRKRLADDLIMSPIGKQAAKEEWVKSLWNFCRRNSRLPQPNEIEGCKREHREFMEAYRQCSISPHPRVRQWLSMGDEMLKRQKEMADYVLNGVVK